MHELPLCETVLSSVRARAQGRPVRHVRVRIGAKHHATQEAFEHLFQSVARGTEAADATIELDEVSATFACDCGAAGSVDARIPLCPDCDEPVRPVGGDELVVAGVDYSA